MPASDLSADSTIGDWLADPAGSAALGRLLSGSGASPSAFDGAHQLTLNELVPLSSGAFTPDDIARLVEEVGGKVVEVASSVTPAPRAPEWKEVIISGRFAGKTVIVTGAGSGIGRATAVRIAKEGGRVVAADISEERLQQLLEEHAELDLIAAHGDISNGADVERIVAAAGGRIDGLANVAGIMDNMSPLHEVSDELWDRVLRINLTGMFKLSRAVIPFMLDAGSGSIVNVASESALRGSSSGLAYTASKHAVVGITRSSAFMYGPSGLRINCVAPGSTVTNIQASFDSALGRERILPVLALAPAPVPADRLAASITFLLSDDGVNLNGVVLPSDGGQSVI
ncbi:SDR family NAD(P)-dependent oxidoreductase [Microbacterium phyllosphaerae]|uniref:SDR family NAD(P)-dependent oxidoreductase n=1 Tax=Microbacterium phyllosphaerae TaxID=124798 RepID=UPI000EA2EDCB|nr:SDR family NAD(P)-dependent oxidoreductase [Microbacterium phyllosphaerae]